MENWGEWFKTMKMAEQVKEETRVAWYRWWDMCERAKLNGVPQATIRDLAPHTHASRRSILWRATRLKNLIAEAKQ